MPSKPKKPASGTPRGRTHAHMKWLLKTAVAGAALGGSACGGPVVCDPLPSPICDKNPTTQTFLNGGYVQSSARWQQTDGGPLAVAVELDFNQFGSDTFAFNTDPASGDAVIGSIVRTDHKLTFTLSPSAGAKQSQVVILIDCSGSAASLKLSFDVSSPAAGATVSVIALN